MENFETEIEELFTKAEQQRQQGKWQNSIETWNQLLVIAQQADAKKLQAIALLAIGVDYKELRQYQEALKHYDEASSLFRQVNYPLGESGAFNNMGEVHRNIGQYQEALKYYDLALAIFREIDDRSLEATALNNIGLTLHTIGKIQEALNYYNQVLVIRQEINDPDGEAGVLNNIGGVYESIGQYEEALKYFSQASAIYREIKHYYEEGLSLNNIGEIYRKIGQYEEALKYFSQALAIRRKIKDSDGEAKSLNSIGVIAQYMGLTEEALKYYHQALPIIRKVNNRVMEASILNNIGAAYEILHQYQEALTYHQQALVIRQEFNDFNGEVKTFNNLGIVYFQIGQYQEALSYFNKAFAIVKKYPNRSVEATIFSNIALVHRNTNRSTEAITNWEKSVSLTLQTRRNLLRENRQSFIQDNQLHAIALTDLLIEQNRAERAYEWINLVTTFELANYTSLIKAKVTNPQAQLAVDKWEKKTRELAALYERLQNSLSESLSQQIRSLEAEVNQLAENTIDQFPEIAELLETTPEDINKLRANLPSDTVVIQPVLLTDNNIDNVPNSIAVFILSKDQPLTVTQVSINPKEFDDLISQYRNKLQNRRARGYKSVGGELYDLLIRPVEEQIKTLSPNRIAIIPTGKLRYIPFETLYDQQTKQYLIEKYPVHYLTRLSVNSLESEKQAISNQQGILALGNPVPVEPYSLPGAEAEVESISQILPGSEKYVGKKATLDTFKFQGLQFPFLHLATHGCFQPEGCCFKSEGCSPNDMDMEANTILFANQNSFHIRDAALLGMKNVELITLSACQTALKADSDGREIAGLAYLFERAGAKAVMASLWGADDETTKEIMVQFYQNLDQGMSKVDALREAKLKHTKRHPFYWSPFILVGNGN
ncbi:CHAT domain-containing protein [Waterburya agarophytonicola]|nr:CHAT domain-containing tetratricopeptide repeat protein [Waterburya agarophytonicola]